MKKRVLALLLVLAMVFALTACGGQGGAEEKETKGGSETKAPETKAPETQSAGGELAGEYKATIWCADAIVDLTKKQIEDFNASNDQGIKIVATVEPVGESDAATQMITDVEAGGDLFCFAQDQFARLVQAGALAKLGVAASEFVKTNNDDGSIAASTMESDLYAYPLTSDNGYFMYYDKSVIPEEDVDSLEKLIADCEKAQKYFSMETETSAWYLASFFFGTGCKTDWKTDKEGNWSLQDTFNSPEGLAAAKGMKKLLDSKFYLSASDGAGFSSNCAVVVTGTWAYTTVKGILGDNMGVADLPSFNVDGKDYHMGSFSGFKLMGVKPQKDAKKAAAMHLLAQYLSGEKGQMERFEQAAWGPSNKADQATDAVKSNVALAALYEQNKYATVQGQIAGAWWDIAKVIGTDVKNAKDEAGLQKALDNYSASIKEFLDMDPEAAAAWGVIGSICGTNWDTDLPMTEKESGIFQSEVLDLKAGDELKVRQGASWDENYGVNGKGGDNLKVEADGKYIVQLDLNKGELTIIAQ